MHFPKNEQPTNQRNKQPTKQATKQSTNQAINQATNQATRKRNKDKTMDPHRVLPPTAIMLRRRLGEDSTSTQSPTDASTVTTTTSQQKSSSSNSTNRTTNSNSTTNEPLLTTGETIGALFIGSVSILIGLYFLLLFVRVRRYRKKQPLEMEDDYTFRGSIRGWNTKERRRKRPKSMVETSDHHEDGSLTILGGDDFDTVATASTTAIIESTPNTNHPAQNHSDENSTKASTIELELADASHYSLSSEDGDTSSAARNNHNRNKKHPKNGNGRDKHKDKDKRTKSTESSSNTSATRTEFSTRSYSLTSVLVNAILPGRSNDDHDDETNLDSYYTRHNDHNRDHGNDDDDDDASNDIVDKTNGSTAHDNDDESTGTFSSPFHPLPSPTTTTGTGTRLLPTRRQSSKSQSKSSNPQRRAYFLSNDDSVFCGEAGGDNDNYNYYSNYNANNNNNNSVITILALEEDVFTGIPEEDRPFDCDTGLPAREDQPFDC